MRKSTTVSACIVGLLLSFFMADALALTAQTITGFAPATPIVYSPGARFALSATGGGSGNPVVFASTTTSVCTVAGTLASVLGAGTCTLTANQAGNAAFSAAKQVSKSVVVNKAAQTIAFGALPSRNLGTPPFTVAATATSGLAVTFTSGTTTVCTVSGGTVTLRKGGTCTIAANQAGNANYSAATAVTQSFAVVTLPSQAITGFAPATPVTFSAGLSFVLAATGGASGNPVVFSTTTPSVCTVTGTVASVLAAGTCTLKADQAGNASYSAAPQVSASVVINKAAQTIAFDAVPSSALNASPLAIRATASSGLAVAVTSATTMICTVAGTAVTLVKVGTCTLRANQAGNANFNAATQVSRSFTIVAAGPTARIDSPANNSTVEEPATIAFGYTTWTPPGSTLARIALYQNGLQVASITPGTGLILRNVLAGAYNFAIAATDSNGVSGTSPAVAVTVKPAIPVVTLSRANSGQNVDAPATILLSATATTKAPGATIARVDFYNGTTLLGTSQSQPWSFTWPNVPAGNYVLRAIATDSAGTTGGSAALNLSVDGADSCSSTSALAAEETSRLASALGNMPIDFEENAGQAHADVRLLARGPGFQYFLTDNGRTIALLPALPSSKSAEGPEEEPSAGQDAVAIRMHFVGANRRPVLNGLHRVERRSNYLQGENPAQWHTGVRHFAQARYHDLYPGIDEVHYGVQGAIESDLIVAPGADPAVIRLGIDGVDKVLLDETGDLLLQTPLGTLIQKRPVAYQEIAGQRRLVEVRYRLEPDEAVTFELGDYDASRELVIDPVLVYSTLLGGSDRGTHGYAIALSRCGEVFVAGSTQATDFPTTPGAFMTSGPQSSVSMGFVSKLDRTGTTLLYSTYLGSASGAADTSALALAVDSSGHAYVAGTTKASDFPTTPGVPFPIKQTNGLGFVTKLNKSGSAPVYSTFMPNETPIEAIAVDGTGKAFFGFREYIDSLRPDGTSGDSVYFNSQTSGIFIQSLAADTAGNLYVAGTTSSTSFNMPDNAFQSRNPAADPATMNSGFVVRLGYADNLTYLTYLGATTSTELFGIAVDGAGSAYVTGSMKAGGTIPNFSDAVTTFTAGPDHPDNDYAFVAKLNPAGTGLVYLSRFGGANCAGSQCSGAQTWANSIAVDGAGNAWITGPTRSNQVPLVNPLASRFSAAGAGPDLFVARLDASGTQLGFSTLFGGETPIATSPYVFDVPSAVGVVTDSAGAAYVAGNTRFSDFPVTAGAYKTVLNSGAGSNAFVVKFGGPDPSAFPSVTLTGITDGATFAASSGSTYAGAIVTLNAAAAIGNTLQEERVYQDGNYVRWTGDGATFSANYNLPALTPGFHTVSGSATDNFGHTSSSVPIRFIVNPPDSAPPAVALNLPADGSSVSSPGPVNLVATATAAPGKSIVSVAYYQGAMLIASAAAPTFSYLWTNVAPGRYSIVAVAMDSAGVRALSAPIALTVTPLQPGPPPAPTLISAVPGPGSATLTFSPPAGDGGSPITGYFGRCVAPGQLVRTATVAADFAFVIVSGMVGGIVYGCSVNAISTLGTGAASRTINVTVMNTPDVAITLPANNVPVGVNNAVDVLVVGVAAPGIIARMEIYDGPAQLVNYVPAGQPSGLNLKFTWRPTVVGPHPLTARMTDTSGKVIASGVVSVIAVSAPVVTLSSNGRFFLAPGDIDLYPKASSPNGTVAKVELLSGSNVVATLLGPPWSYRWSGVGAGTYSLTARATDNAGVVATSAPVNVKVGNAMSITVDPGNDGMTVNDDNVSFGGQLDAPANSAVDVNGRLGVRTEDGRFFFNGFPLDPGVNSITVTVTNIDGQSASQTMAVTRSGQAPFAFIASNPVGYPTLSTSFTLINRTGVPFSRIELSCNDDGVADRTFTKVEEVSGVACTFGVPGNARARITVYGSNVEQPDQVIFTDTQTMYEASIEATDRMLRGTYTDMLDRLATGRIAPALNTITVGSADKYGAVFSSIPNLPVAIAQLGTIQEGLIHMEFAEYVLGRPSGDITVGYFIYFLKGNDGIWRIDAM